MIPPIHLSLIIFVTTPEELDVRLLVVYFDSIRHVILGGGAVVPDQHKIQDFRNCTYVLLACCRDLPGPFTSTKEKRRVGAVKVRLCNKQQS